NVLGPRRSGLTLALAARPMLPTTAAASSLRMSPIRLVATITSNVAGRLITYMLEESTWLLVVRTSGYSAATSAKTSSQSTITCASALDLVTQWTYFLPL